jgi:tetratricopeptide (TPR) repeat protein
MVLRWLKPGKEEKKPVENTEHLLVDGIDAFENGNFKAAAEAFIAIANTKPNHPLAHLLLARSFIQLREYARAVEALLNHLDVDPNSVEGYIYLGLVYYDLNESRKSQEAFEKALRLKSDSLLARENLAIARIKAGELDEAVDELTALHEERPGDKAITELLILALGQLGHWDTAKRYAAYSVADTARSNPHDRD